MADSDGATPQRAFGVMLGHYRSLAGLTPEQLGPRVFLSGSMIRKVETGDRNPTQDLVDALEAVPELELRGALKILYKALKHQLKNGLPYPGWFADWPDKEAVAIRLRTFSLVVIDGLFQTEEYMRAVLATKVGATQEWIDETVKGRLARQKILERADPPEIWAVIDEAALRRPVGSAQVMARQLKRVSELARRPNIVVQVIPMGAGSHEGLRGGPFVVAEFAEAPMCAYQDAATGGQIIEAHDSATELAHLWDTARVDALPRAASLKFLEQCVEQAEGNGTTTE